VLQDFPSIKVDEYSVPPETPCIMDVKKVKQVQRVPES
jgi:hypothetical protein